MAKVQYESRKLCIEFQKRMNPSLPSYYYTSSHDRFFEGPRASFDDPRTSTSRNPRHQLVRRKEQLGLLAPGRVTMATSGALSTRTIFHNVPVELPPPPNASVINEHSYA